MDKAEYFIGQHLAAQPRRLVGCWMFFLLLLAVCSRSTAADRFAVLQPATISPYVARFNAMENEDITNFVPNAASGKWLQQNIPVFECPDKEVEEMYYFRWWAFRKHLVKTPEGFVFTEFLTPVKHAGVYNTISCATAFHIAEARWLCDSGYAEDYIRFWLRGNGGSPQPHFHKYSSWFADAVYQDYLVTGDRKFAVNLLKELVADYRAWETERQLPNGLFWQFDVRDGMEESISGSRTNKNMRPTLNSYMFANARAIAEVARLANRADIAREFDAKAARLRQLVLDNLWNTNAAFFEAKHQDGSFANVREELGFIPWMFGLAGLNPGYSSAWLQLTDPQGFLAPAGITTAERRHPQFRSHGVGNCEWDGAVWPFATCQTLYGLANLLRDPVANSPLTDRVSRSTFYDSFLTYVHSQHANGKPYVGEYLDEVTGDWINGKNDRSRYYNHSTFADLLVTDLVGLVPRNDNAVEISPLLPDGVWDWFCLDGVKYHGRNISIIWDAEGTHYHRGKGLIVLADGKEIARGAKLEKLTGKLP